MDLPIRRWLPLWELAQSRRSAAKNTARLRSARLPLDWRRSEILVVMVAMLDRAAILNRGNAALRLQDYRFRFAP